jgi:hypothetical protein
MKTVYIIDEEYHFAENVASAIRFEGPAAIVFHDATEALKYFLQNHARLNPLDIKLLVDVSLAAGEDLATFSVEATDDFYKTGIVLVSELKKRCPNLCKPENTILYTAHFKTELWDRIETFCKENGYSNWQKAPNTDVSDIISLIADMLGSDT